MKKEKKRHTQLWLILIGCLIILVPVALILIVRLEGEAPVVDTDRLSSYLGRSQELTISVSDAKSGLRNLWVGILKDGKESVLHDESFPSRGFLKGGSLHETSVTIPVAPKDLGYSDGKATLRMVVRDYSWRDWWKGNRTYAEKEVLIDTRPPAIEVLSRAHNVNQGGAGLAIFRTSEDCTQSGVQVGDRFYPGHPGFFNDARVYVAFFALGYDQGTDTAIHLKATDLAGNEGQGGLNYHLRRKVFRKDRINITDDFLAGKLPDSSNSRRSSSSSGPTSSRSTDSVVPELRPETRTFRFSRGSRFFGAISHPPGSMRCFFSNLTSFALVCACLGRKVANSSAPLRYSNSP